MPSFNRGFFDDFDPLTGDLPELATVGFDYIVKQARDLLKNRTSQEIQDAHLDLRLLLNKAESDEFRNDFLPRLHQEKEIAFFPTTSRLMHRCAQLFELSEDWGFWEGKWSEYYAVMALALTGQAKASELEPHPGTSLESAEHIRRQTAWADELGEDALEMVGAAYALQAVERKNAESIDEGQRRRLRQIAPLGGKRRHSESRELKELAFVFWSEKRPENKSEGARQFLRSFPDRRVQAALPGEHRVQTVCDWFREFQRGEFEPP